MLDLVTNNSDFTLMFWLYVHFDESDWDNRESNGKGGKCSLFGNRNYYDNHKGLSIVTDWTRKYNDSKSFRNNRAQVSVVC